MGMSMDLGTVEDRSFVISGFRLQNGSVFAEAKIAYESYGRLAL
jgi:homoserine acetyltransferase